MPIRLPFLRAVSPAASPPERSALTRRAVLTVEVDGRLVEVAVRRSARAKRFVLRLNRTGDGASVTLPARGSLAAARDFLERHVGWLSGRLAAPAGDAAPLPASLPLRGQSVAVVYTLAPRGLSEVVAGAAPAIRVAGAPEHARRRLLDLLKRLARADIEAAVTRHAGTLGVVPASITLRDPASRWGSASRRGLNFSWRLILAPPFVLDYVAAHEVAHLREMNHSPRFWAICRSLAPRTDEARAWLKANGAALHRLV